MPDLRDARAWLASRWSALPRWQRACWLFSIASPLLRALTYSSWADGLWANYYAQLSFLVGLAAGTWWLVRVQMSPGALLPWIAAAGVLLPGDTVHYWRLTHPSNWQREQVVADDFTQPNGDGHPDPTQWTPDLQPGAIARVQEGELRIVNPPNTAGYVDLLFPERPPRPPDEDFWLPRGLFHNQFTESLQWEARLSKDRDFYVMLDIKTLLLQASPFGLQITLTPPGAQPVQQLVERPRIDDGAAHRFQLARSPARLTLHLDGRQVWSGPSTGEWAFVRFGETRTDVQHGGTLRVDKVRYSRRFSIAPPAG